ncbi:MAG: tetratricopeptide repeat protein [Flavobacteriales bacterium]|nr:tetratricopeptide repeat protein [Flavobacteriales bacterium]
MPTRATDTNPFAPRGSLSREDLLAYAERRLPPDREHEVESHVEADPLLAEALEGLRLHSPDASSLETLRPRGRGWMLWLVSGAVVMSVSLAWVLWSTEDRRTLVQEPSAQKNHEMISDEDVIRAIAELPVEIAVAQEQPESLRIGHGAMALHTREVAVPRIIRDSLERIEARAAQLKPGDSSTSPRIGRRAKASRQSIFLHDMKLVHPQELYTSDPVMRLAEAGVLARFADRQDQGRAKDESIMLPYTAFMDEAIGRFANGDHKAALDDLRFVLNQYPDDVNALFYAGLCAYNIGLHERARQLLHRAATHPVDVFDEEAAWYHALALERLGDPDAAREALMRIVGAAGFYADAAKTRLGNWKD